MLKQSIIGLVFALGFAGTVPAATLGVEKEDFPVLSGDGKVTWEADSTIGLTTLDLSLVAGDRLKTGPSSEVETFGIDGWVFLEFDYDDLSSIGNNGSLVLELELALGNVVELVASLTKIGLDPTAAGGPTINLLFEILPIATSQFFKDMFGNLVIAQIQLDADLIPSEFDRENLFKPAGNDIGGFDLNGFFSMHKVKSPDETGGGGGDGGNVPPVPLPASLPLLLIGIGSLAWIRRRV